MRITLDLDLTETPAHRACAIALIEAALIAHVPSTLPVSFTEEDVIRREASYAILNPAWDKDAAER